MVKWLIRFVIKVVPRCVFSVTGGSKPPKKDNNSNLKLLYNEPY